MKLSSHQFDFFGGTVRQWGEIAFLLVVAAGCGAKSSDDASSSTSSNIGGQANGGSTAAGGAPANSAGGHTAAGGAIATTGGMAANAGTPSAGGKTTAEMRQPREEAPSSVVAQHRQAALHRLVLRW